MSYITPPKTLPTPPRLGTSAMALGTFGPSIIWHFLGLHTFQQHDACLPLIIESGGTCSGFCSPNLESKLGATSPPRFGLRLPPFLTQVFLSILGFFPLLKCWCSLPSENREEVLIYNLIKTSPLFFTGCKLRPPGIKTEATGNM